MARTVKAPEERRQELIDTARQLFYTQGYESTSVHDIVTAVGVSQGTFYYYFDAKQDVLEALVTDLVDQSFELFDAIVADETLDVVQKWKRAFQIIGNWKLARKPEMLAYVSMVRSDANVLFYHKLRTQVTEAAVPALAGIIAQGVQEGTFATLPAAQDAKLVAGIVYVIARHLSDKLVDLISHPDIAPDAEALALHTFAVGQQAIERVLGATPGSLPMVSEDTLRAWFSK
ncbi:MAG: TetR/AcrR family transcriptional regulator [Anaerolineae bacterium]|nr:TetR/AcrR family transcriptional regulator [Anaerolineae bacterium]